MSPSAEPLDLRFSSGAAAVHGSVTDSKGDTVPNAIVALRSMSEPSPKYQGFTPTIRTDQDGLFELRGLIPGEYVLYWWPPTIDIGMTYSPDFLKRSDANRRVLKLGPRDDSLLNLHLTEQQPTPP